MTGSHYHATPAMLRVCSCMSESRSHHINWVVCQWAHHGVGNEISSDESSRESILKSVLPQLVCRARSMCSQTQQDPTVFAQSVVLHRGRLLDVNAFGFGLVCKTVLTMDSSVKHLYPCHNSETRKNMGVKPFSANTRCVVVCCTTCTVAI